MPLVKQRLKPLNGAIEVSSQNGYNIDAAVVSPVPVEARQTFAGDRLMGTGCGDLHGNRDFCQELDDYDEKGCNMGLVRSGF